MASRAGAAGGSDGRSTSAAPTALLRLLTAALAGGAVLLLWGGPAGARAQGTPPAEPPRASGDLVDDLLGDGGALTPVIDLVDTTVGTPVAGTTVDGVVQTVAPVIAPVLTPALGAAAPVTTPVVDLLGDITGVVTGTGGLPPLPEPPAATPGVPPLPELPPLLPPDPTPGPSAAPVTGPILPPGPEGVGSGVLALDGGPAPAGRAAAHEDRRATGAAGTGSGMQASLDGTGSPGPAASLDRTSPPADLTRPAPAPAGQLPGGGDPATVPCSTTSHSSSGASSPGAHLARWPGATPQATSLRIDPSDRRTGSAPSGGPDVSPD